jgi:hydroxymethylpyrimidine/phosphomethylpyrimidine kinase
MPTALTIAGHDPSSGAGITADLMVFAAHGLFGISAITALTVQSTLGVRATHPVASNVLADSLATLHADLPPDGIKIGMLATSANVAAVCEYIEALRAASAATRRIPIVLDPVLVSSSGRELLSPDGLALLRTRLLPLVDWVTPNLAELAALTGLPTPTRETLADAARKLQREVAGGRLTALATGGHLDPPDDLLLLPGGERVWLPGERVETRATHGTGCALSSALLARLVLGDGPNEAARAAKAYVAEALRTATPRGHGFGPMHHLWPLSERL